MFSALQVSRLLKTFQRLDSQDEGEVSFPQFRKFIADQRSSILGSIIEVTHHTHSYSHSLTHTQTHTHTHTHTHTLGHLQVPSTLPHSVTHTHSDTHTHTQSHTRTFSHQYAR